MPYGVNRVKHGLQCTVYRRMKTFYDSVFFFLNEFLIIPPAGFTSVHDVMLWVSLGSVKMKPVLPNPKLQCVLLTGFID